MSEIQEFLDRYIQFLSHRFEIYKVGDLIIVETPFLDGHNDAIGIIIEPRSDGGFKISSDVLDTLEIADELDELTWINYITISYGVTIEKNQVVALADADNFVRIFHQVLSATIILSNMR